MDTSVKVDMPSRPAHDSATAPGRFVVRDAHREDLPEAAAVQAVCFREIGQGVIPDDILTEVTGPGIVHTTIEQWKQFMDDGAVFKILVDRLDMRTVGVAMARISTSPDAPTPWEVVTAGPRTISSTPASDIARPMCGSSLITPARSSSTSATGSTSTTLMVPSTTLSVGWNFSGSFVRTRSKPNDGPPGCCRSLPDTQLWGRRWHRTVQRRGQPGGEFGAAPPSGAVTPTRRRSRVPQVWEESFVVSSWMCRATCFSLSS